MKKKIISLVLCLAVAAATLVGCGSTGSTGSTDGDKAGTNASEDAAAEGDDASSESDEKAADVSLDGSWPEEKILIGVESFDTTDEQFLKVQEYYEYLAEHFNIGFMYSESIASAEDELNFISSCAAAGAKAVIGYYNVTGVEAAQQAIDQGMYYWTADINIYNELKDDEMYLGTYEFAGVEEGKTGDYIAGYELGYGLANSEATRLLYCNGGASFGVQMFIERQSGFFDGVAAAQAEGAEVEFDQANDVIEGWPGTDEFAAAQSAALSADYDGVAVSFNAATWFQPISDAGKSDVIKLAAIGQVADTYYNAMNTGQMATLVYDCEEVVFGHIVASIVNAVNGHTDVVRTAEGAASSIRVNRWVISSAEEYDIIFDYHEDGNYFISAEDMTQCFPEFNSDASYESVNNLYEQFTLDYAMNMLK